MYNEELKRRYIEEKTATTVMTDGYLDRVFNKTEPFEEKAGKDVSCFMAHEIRNMYSTWNVNSSDFLINLHSALNQYTRWAMLQGIVFDAQNHYEEIERRELAKLINVTYSQMKIINEATLDEWINSLSEACDRFLLRAVFEGISGKNYCELVNIKLSDFTTYGTVKLCTGREIKISNKLYQLAIEAENTYDYCGNNGHASRTYPLYGDDLIFKTLPQSGEADDFQKGRRIYNKSLKIFKWLGVDKWMTINSLQDSGKIHWLTTRKEITGMDPIECFYEGKEESRLEPVKEFANQFGGVHKFVWYRKYEEYLV